LQYIELVSGWTICPKGVGNTNEDKQKDYHYAKILGGDSHSILTTSFMCSQRGNGTEGTC